MMNLLAGDTHKPNTGSSGFKKLKLPAQMKLIPWNVPPFSATHPGLGNSYSAFKTALKYHLLFGSSLEGNCLVCP